MFDIHKMCRQERVLSIFVDISTDIIQRRQHTGSANENTSLSQNRKT